MAATNGEPETLVNIYKYNIKIERNDRVMASVKEQIRERIWPNTKFTTMNIIQDTPLMESGGFIDEILVGLNVSFYNEFQRAKFWNRYGKEVLNVLSSIKSNVASGIKKQVVDIKLCCIDI